MNRDNQSLQKTPKCVRKGKKKSKVRQKKGCFSGHRMGGHTGTGKRPPGWDLVSSSFSRPAKLGGATRRDLHGSKGRARMLDRDMEPRVSAGARHKIRKEKSPGPAGSGLP